jgi:eukaryotic-like serine/threonine-protein kinase
MMSVARKIEKALFEAARELDDLAERSAFLDQVCHGQPELRCRLEKLLAVQAPADEFFRAIPLREMGSNPAPNPVAGSGSPSPGGSQMEEGISAVVGRYRLLERLGEGGCGVVYLAEQQEPVRRRLALKIIRLGMDTESVIARFKAERQALALMDHPNIAHVLDAGATESGRPYFVMELVQGVKITDYCNHNQLNLSQRLKLFIQVCQAIQHAHLKGVIHRDIKPSNILVPLHDGVAVPKVIDFGIAKATQGRLADNAVYTAQDQFIGTPAYMSPEQASGSGLDVDTRSDIYSLGVLLYELLTGQTPFDSKELVKHGMAELRRTLHEQEPPPPSTLLTNLGDTRLTVVAAQHGAEPPRLVSSLRGDLDWIVMKALEKDRNRRYETANGLAMDVQRYLNNEPVVARPPSRWYRLQKLAQRNRGAFVAVAAVAVSLLVGLGGTTWMFLKEREARRVAVAAEQQQTLLRQESDRLRRAAEYHQKLSQALAILTRNPDRIAEADELIAGLPAPEPNLEYADLYRTLGDWHAAHGRWKSAGERYAALLQVNPPDDWDVTTLDYLRYGPVLLESGDLVGYERFRQSAVAHFIETTNPVPAERVIKMSLLLPVSTNFMAALQPLAVTASKSLANVGSSTAWQSSLSAWRAFSLAMLEYRRGNYAGVEQWYQKSISYDSGNVARSVNFRILLAMTHYQTGQADLAHAELAQAQPKVEKQCAILPTDTGGAYWFDWIFARILLREATALMGEANP